MMEFAANLHLDGLLATKGRLPTGAVDDVLSPAGNIGKRLVLALGGNYFPRPNRQELWSVESYIVPPRAGSFNFDIVLVPPEVLNNLLYATYGAAIAPAFASLWGAAVEKLSGKPKENDALRGLVQKHENLDYNRLVLVFDQLEKSFAKLASQVGKHFESIDISAGLTGSLNSSGSIDSSFKEEVSSEHRQNTPAWMSVTVRGFDRGDTTGVVVLGEVSARGSFRESGKSLPVHLEFEVEHERDRAKEVFANNLNVNTTANRNQLERIEILAQEVTSRSGRVKRLIVSAVQA